MVTIDRASSTVAAIGFSTSRSMPRSSSGTATAAWSPVGAATTAASTLPTIAVGSVSALQPCASATLRHDASQGSTTATNSASSRAASRRAWMVPRCPQPITATFVRVMQPSVGEGRVRAAPPVVRRGK